ncbi:ankyrin [Ascobolus immersus RN42]|uniref:Ankyrin n=1 Tax=Ascobolus immersus RN42 TaxID=1160509 RepID=A0A3N4I0F0_ASCIM|nr:ankyrin [Ascobolus immersus RN42]
MPRPSAKLTLYDAVSTSDLSLLDYIFTKRQKPTSEDIAEAFEIACWNGNIEFADILLHRGAKISEDAVLNATRVERSIELFELFLHHGWRINHRESEEHQLPLLTVAEHGDSTDLLWMLQHGADPKLYGIRAGLVVPERREVTREDGTVVVEETDPALLEEDKFQMRMTALEAAAWAGRPVNVELLFEYGAQMDVEAVYAGVECDERTAMKVLRVLVENGVDCNRPMKSGFFATPIICAIYKGGENAIEKIQFLLENGKNVNAACPSGWSTLRHAEHKHGKDSDVYRLIADHVTKQPAHVQKPQQAPEMTPKIYFPESYTLSNLLSDTRLDLLPAYLELRNPSQEQLNQALTSASHHTDHSYATFLLQSGAQITPTAIYNAILTTSTPLLTTLHNHGWNLNPTDASYLNPLAITLASQADTPTVLAWLLAHGANPNLPGLRPKDPMPTRVIDNPILTISALEAAATCGNLPHDRLLLSSGADLDPLAFAAACRCDTPDAVKIMRLLLERGLDISGLEPPALISVVNPGWRRGRRYMLEKVRLLVEMGVDVNATAKGGYEMGRSALSWVEELAERGAEIEMEVREYLKRVGAIELPTKEEEEVMLECIDGVRELEKEE